MNQSEIARYFNKTNGSISKLFKQKSKFENLFKSGLVSDSTKKNTLPKFPEIEIKLQETIKDFRQNNYAVNGFVLKEMALKIHSESSHKNEPFHASDGWKAGYEKEAEM